MNEYKHIQYRKTKILITIFIFQGLLHTIIAESISVERQPTHRVVQPSLPSGLSE